MNLTQLFQGGSRSNPDTLLRQLTVVAIISIITIVILGGYGFYRVFSGFVIKNAEISSVQLCRVLIDEQKELMFDSSSGQAAHLGLHGSEILAFDSRLRHFLAPFNIIKVKIYNPARQIVYSTDSMLIGKVDSHNIRLGHALAGVVDARLVTKDKASDLADEPLRDVDVVETYVPLVSPETKIIGGFEIYMNVTRYRSQIRQGVLIATGLLGMILVAVFGFSYVKIRKGTGQLKQAQSQLELAAKTDSLTNVANRSSLMQRGEEEFERVQRCTAGNKLSFGCIMLDLDHFKRVNDSKGHHAGDQVLTEVGRRLKDSLRPYDVIGRYGGEEFVVLLPNTSFDQTLIVANRILERMRCQMFEASGQQLAISASLGVTVSNETDSCLSDVIARADEGMYKAKADGRDRVAWVYHPYDAELHS